MKNLIQPLLLNLLLISFLNIAQAESGSAALGTFGNDACTDQESWSFSDSLPKNMKTAFTELLTNAPAIGEAAALASTTSVAMAKNDLADSLNQYFKNRVLFREGLIHLAQAGFQKIVLRPITSQTLGVQLSALHCMSVIAQKYPNLALPLTAQNQLFQLSAALQSGGTTAMRESLWRAVALFIRQQISEDMPGPQIKLVLPLLEGSGLYAQHSQGIFLAREGDYPGCIKSLSSFLSTPKLPVIFKPLIENTRITLARCYHQSERYSEAAALLLQVDKKSNRSGQALSEQAWVHFMEKQYDKAVGISMTLQDGIFKTSFLPEANMTIAMALYELCQYQGSLGAIRFYQKKYKPTFAWLSNHRRRLQSGQKTDLYQKVISYLETDQSDIPKPLLNEYGISPIFLANQQELNLLVDQKKTLPQISKDLKEAYKATAQDFNTEAKALKREANNGASADIQSRKTKLLDWKQRLLRQSAFANEIRTALVRSKTDSAQRQKILIQQINRDLSKRNQAMFERLQFLADKAYLIETEIMTAASQDIVWQAANPKYKDYAKKYAKEKQKASSEVMVWGRMGKRFSGKDELWADEVGNLKVDLTDNCASREKYKSVKPE